MMKKKSKPWTLEQCDITFPDQAVLSPCINTYIDNPRIKTLATASAWIGNDETHYVRKHEDYNLEHLKIFISATVSFINSELSYLKAEQLLNTPK